MIENNRNIAWEQRKFSDMTTRNSIIDSCNSELPSIEYEDIVSGQGVLNKDIREKKSIKTGIRFEPNDVLFGKLRPYLKNWILPGFSGVAVGDFWVLHPFGTDSYFLYYLVQTPTFQAVANQSTGTKMPRSDWNLVSNTEFYIPKDLGEQRKIGATLQSIDNLITLHQRKPLLTEVQLMFNVTRQNILFHEYYARWIMVYKKGAIRNVTMRKYHMTHHWVQRLIPELMVGELTRIAYQQLLNDYAQHHERQTTMDFHHQLKGAILDAVDEGLIPRDPTRKAIIKGKPPRPKKTKYLNQYELHTLIAALDLSTDVSWDWLILLIAKTGLRFSEAVALTPDDFDFSRQILSINKTWDYKGHTGFLPTKNKSSTRKIRLDWQTVIQFSELTKDLPIDKPIFVKGKIYNSTVNDLLARRCKTAGLPVISIHGLRHTHASVLLFAGVSIASVARRLGHASMTTTQKTYLHIIQELENQDVDLIMRSLAGLS